ncbi:hypothetical protein [Deinococcus sp. Leaf326]|uniref:hypothetical protein n=1 Tax=Deinococcus sp. Leaf326 TaxID=1736338 RepID=UPI0006F825D7|nr:hypothetical protein [Deinococcus sp. Leaf326]KQR37728.1 hypothetical protein ASF71_14705 [Deinococcus sp. Leaf326]
MTKLPDYTRPVTLSSGVTVTVSAWGLADVAAHATDFQAVLDALTASLRDVPPPMPSQDSMALLTRSIQLSLTRPEDAVLVKACDFPDLLEAIWEVNGLGDLAKKALRLRLEADKVRQALLAEHLGSA